MLKPTLALVFFSYLRKNNAQALCAKISLSMDEVIRDVDTGQPVSQPKQPKKPKAKKILIGLIIVALLAGTFALGYAIRAEDEHDIPGEQQAKINDLEAQVTKLKNDLEAATTASDKSTETTIPDQETRDMITSAINARQVVNIKEHLLNKVFVIHAASEGMGGRTPSQAIKDISADIENSKTPWDFDLSSETLDKYSSGDYAEYFPAGGLVGESADGTVVSFTFNTAGKISVIFIAADSSLL